MTLFVNSNAQRRKSKAFVGVKLDDDPGLFFLLRKTEMDDLDAAKMFGIDVEEKAGSHRRRKKG